MTIIAHNIRSLHNVGAILRSADAFLIEKVYLTGISGRPPRKEIAKVSLGSEHRVAWEGRDDVLSLIEGLKLEGRRVVALDNVESATSISSITESQAIVLIVGNEVEGLEQDVLKACDQIVQIDLPGAKQSLNVSVAAGIAMFALRSQKR